MEQKVKDSTSVEVTENTRVFVELIENTDVNNNVKQEQIKWNSLRLSFSTIRDGECVTIIELTNVSKESLRDFSLAVLELSTKINE